MNNSRSLAEILDIIEDCMHSNKLEFLAKLILKLESEYIEIARITTDDNYDSKWTHKEVLDYITYERTP
jgi:hypothetical protein